MRTIEPGLEPIFVFGGPCSNLEATRAALAEAAARGVAPGRVICTGDVVAYGADARATVDLIRRSGVRVVMGNCEEQLAAGGDDCGCGFAPGGACDLASAQWFAHAAEEIGPHERAWMAALPRRIDVEINGLTLAVVYGGVEAINRFVFASAPARVKALALDLAGVDGIVAGHSGLPFSQVIGGRLWHNAGAIGMPANDGTPRVWFSVLTPGPLPRTLEIEHLSLAYDHPAAGAKMRRAGLPAGYADALSTGLWPSCDVLPEAEAKLTGGPLAEGGLVWRRDELADAAWPAPSSTPRLDPRKFGDPAVTIGGDPRASVALSELRTLWINTGTLCNLACANCYIESTPKNDRLVYISAAEVSAYLDEIARERLPVELIGFTGGEPFMNPDIMSMLTGTLERGFSALVLTNAMRPMQRHRKALRALKERFGTRLTVRVSIDHYTQSLHELERGPRSWRSAIDGLVWLSANGFSPDVAGRLYSGEAEGVVRAGYAALFAELGIAVDAFDPVRLTLFPEMDETADVPEISDGCWDVLGARPQDQMCATSRMVVKRRGAERPAVLACTLIAYDEAFELGETLAEAARPVSLNHPHCARFCVLGGAACSA